MTPSAAIVYDRRMPNVQLSVVTVRLMILCVREASTPADRRRLTDELFRAFVTALAEGRAGDVHHIRELAREIDVVSLLRG